MTLEIVAIEAIPIIIPLLRPLKMAIATVKQRDSLLVRVHTKDGPVGLGEAVLAEYFTGETQIGAKHVVEQLLTPALVGLDAFNLHAIGQRMDRVLTGNPATKAAIDIALHDLVAKALNIPLYKFLGGKVRDRVESTWYLYGTEPEYVTDEAQQGVEQGFRAIKIKVGALSPKIDLQRLKAVRRAIGEEPHLHADANQAWTPVQAINFLNAAAEYNLQFIEQPVKRNDMAGMAKVSQEVATPVASDEGLFDANDALRYIRANAADGVVMKLIKTAGLVGARRLAAVAQTANLGLHFAGMPGETSIAAAAGVHLAATLPNLTWGSGFYPDSSKLDVVTEPLRPIEGAYVLPETPGLGVELDEDALAHCIKN